MKVLALLLSVYMTCLALLPCQDKDDQAAYSFNTTISKNKACNDRGNQESCPPFCTCACCSTARSLTVMDSTTLFSKHLSPVYPDFQIPAIQDQPIKVWQPPQIA